MTNQWAIHDERKHGAALWWICNRNEANSGEHKTKRSLTTRLGALRPSMCRGCLSSLRPATVRSATPSQTIGTSASASDVTNCTYCSSVTPAVAVQASPPFYGLQDVLPIKCWAS